MDSHPSIGPPTFDKTPIDLNDVIEFSLESHPSIGLPKLYKTPIDLNDALDFSLESHPSVGLATFEKTPIDLFVEEGGLDGERKTVVDHGKVQTMVNDDDIGDPSVLKKY